MLKAYYYVPVCIIAENNVDGATFVKFTRDDLKDIFPTNFIFRKKIWDYLEDIPYLLVYKSTSYISRPPLFKVKNRISHHLGENK